MKATNDALIVLSTLEDGALKADFSKELTTVLASLNSLSENSPKSTLKGSLTLKLNISMQDGVATLQADITSKLPKIPRRSSIRWVEEDGSVTTEHPNQTSLFEGPRAVDSVA